MSAEGRSTGNWGAPSLAGVLAPIPVAEFLERWRARRWLLIEGDRGKFDGLFSWEALNRVIRESERDATRFKLVKAGKAVSREAFTQPGEVPSPHRNGKLSIIGLLEQLRNGATLIVHGLHEASDTVKELAADLEQRLREDIHVNAYAAWRTIHGLAAHWDDHDVFILQVHGRKQWRVFPDNRPHPVLADPVRHELPAEAAWSGTLREGDVLYIPRGWWHEAVPMDEPCLHLTVGLENRTGLHYLEWLKNRLTASEIFRQDLPRFAEPEAQREHFARLRQELLSAMGPDAGADYLRSLDVAREVRVEPRLPDIRRPNLRKSGS